METSMKIFLGFLVALFVSPAAFAETFVCDGADYHLTINATKGASQISYAICEFHECDGGLMGSLGLIRSSGSDDTYDISPNGHRREELVVSYAASGLLAAAVVRNDGYNIQFFNDCRPFR